MPKIRSVRLDLDDSQVKGLSLDQNVTVQVKGKVRELEASRMGYDYEAIGDSPEKKVKVPPKLELEVSSVKILSAKSNVFTKLADDSDEEN